MAVAVVMGQVQCQAMEFALISISGKTIASRNIEKVQLMTKTNLMKKSRPFLPQRSLWDKSLAWLQWRSNYAMVHNCIGAILGAEALHRSVVQAHWLTILEKLQYTNCSTGEFRRTERHQFCCSKLSIRPDVPSNQQAQGASHFPSNCQRSSPRRVSHHNIAIHTASHLPPSAFQIAFSKMRSMR